MKIPPGSTRTRVKARHALITPDGQVASQLPGIQGARVVAHITPAMGAKFAQATVFFEAGGRATFPEGADEFVFYVVAGELELALGGKSETVRAGGYVYQPPGSQTEWRAEGAATLIFFQKKYCSLASHPVPGPVIGREERVQGQPFLGNPQALLQVLLPEDLSFDLAVNIFTYQPGASLPFVETHVMEHGLLMLAGQGDYVLEESRYEVMAGDVIWMAPFCPQWFEATGETPASYIYYKDVNRPLLPT